MSNHEKLLPLGSHRLTGNHVIKVLSTKTKNENIIIAPWSTQMLIGLSHKFLAQDTRIELEKTISIDDINTFPENYKTITDFISSVKCINFQEKYRILTNEGSILRKLLEEAITNRYKAVMQIEISDNNNHSDNMLIFENIVSFKGKWDCKFNHVYDGEFSINDDETVQVPMMNITQHFNYKIDDYFNAKVVEVPFASKKLSMLVIIPTTGCELEPLQTKLLAVGFEKVVENLERKFISLHLPKMKIEKVSNVGNILHEMGVTSLSVRDKCKLSGMVTKENQVPYVGEIIQRIYLEVDEDGYPLPPPPRGPTGRCFCRTIRDAINVNRPFIMYVKTNEPCPRIIFQCQISNPLLKKNTFYPLL